MEGPHDVRWDGLAEREAWAKEASWGGILPLRGVEVGHLDRAVRLLARLFDAGAAPDATGGDLIAAAMVCADGVHHSGRWGSLHSYAVGLVATVCGGRWPHTAAELRHFVQAVLRYRRGDLH